MRIFVADHALLNYRGHYYNYAKAVCNEFKIQGYETHVLGNKQVNREIASDLLVHKTFTLGHDHQLKELGFDLASESYLIKKMKYKFFSQVHSSIAQNMIAYERHFKKDLDDLMEDFELGEQDLLVINSVRHEELFAYASWIKNQKQKQRLPHFLFILHFTIYPCADVGNTYRDIYSAIFSLFESCGMQDRLHFFTDSASLANEYKTITRFEFNVLPIPHNSHTAVGSISSPIAPENKPATIAYLGVALSIKGFPFIPYVVSKMREQIRAKKASFQLQIQHFGEKSILMAADRLSFYDIDLYHGTLSTELYYQIMERSDIILLPYSLDFYHSQTSGVFSEAMALGKVPIVPRGTWMAQEAERFGVGRSFFPSDLRSFSESVLAVYDNIDEERKKAKEASISWNLFHCPNSFVNSIKTHLRSLFSGI